MFKFIRMIQQKWLYSLVGLFIAIKEEKSIWTYLIISPIVIGVGFWIKLSNIEWAITIALLFIMIAIEVLNTALEAAVDTISFQYNINVKKIKDIASAATLVTSVGSSIALLIIYIPGIVAVF